MKPNPQQISETIAKLQARLRKPEMNHSANRGVREGYNEAINILAQNVTTYNGISSRLRTVQGRTIGVLAVDYVNGEESDEGLINVPVTK